MPHAISTIQQLHPYEGALGSLGYTTYEQFYYAAQVVGPELAAYLGLPSIDSLLIQVPVKASSITRSKIDRIEALPCALGAALDQVPRPAVAPSVGPVRGAYEASVNLIPQMPDVRDQGVRGTCVAHAALSVYEHYLNTSGAAHDLSEQFLYWNCKRSDGHPNEEGTWLGVACPLLKRDGVCLEAAWPYHGAVIPGSEGQGPPPPGAQLEALAYRLPDFKSLAATSVSDLKSELLRGRSIAASIPVFNSWYLSREVRRTGEITNPIPNEPRTGGHAVCLAGYVDAPDSQGIDGGRFIVRNSWGKNWAMDSVFGPGYGSIPYSYLARFGVEAYAVT